MLAPKDVSPWVWLAAATKSETEFEPECWTVAAWGPKSSYALPSLVAVKVEYMAAYLPF